MSLLLELFLGLDLFSDFPFELFICCPELGNLPSELFPRLLVSCGLAFALTGGAHLNEHLFGSLLAEVLLDLFTSNDFVLQLFVGCCQFGSLLLEALLKLVTAFFQFVLRPPVLGYLTSGLFICCLTMRVLR